MNNFDVARDALETSLNSAGSAMAEHEKWSQSLEAKILSLKASWQGLAQSFMSSDFLKSALDSVVALVQGLEWLIDKVGTLPTLIGAFAGGYSLFNNKGFLTFDKNTKSIKILGDSLDGLKSKYSQIQTAISRYNSMSSKSASFQEKYNKAMAGSSTSMGKYLSGLKDAKASFSGYIGSLVGATVKTVALEAATIALNAAITMGIGALIGLAVKALDELIVTSDELAEKVEEVTSKYKEQHNELKKLKGNYDTSNESSMISKYEELSKGVDNLGRNVSLTAEEYSEYQSIVNNIADQIPSLVSGYDEQGNALLSCKGNVEQLTEAYEKLVHAQNQQILTNVGDIEKNFGNTLDKASGKGLWADNHGFWAGFVKSDVIGRWFADFLDYDLKDDTVKGIENILNATSENSRKKALESLKNDRYSKHELKDALTNAGIDVGAFESPFDVLEETLEKDPQKVRNIIGDYYEQFAEIVEQQKTIATAKLSEAFDVSSAISGLNYGNISEELQEVAYQTVNSLDYDFFSELSEKGKTVEQWTTEMLNQLNAINKTDNAKIEAGFELQTEFNGGKISYGEYVKNLQNLESTIDGLNLKSETKEQLKIKLGLDDEGVIDQYNALVKRLSDSKNYDFDISETEAKKLLDGLSSDELAIAVDVITEMSNNNVNETIEQVRNAIDRELALQGLTLDLTIETETTKLEALATALGESVSGSGLTSESLGAIEGIFSDLTSYDPSKLFERTANGIRLNTTELNRLNSEYKDSNLTKVNSELDALGDIYNQTREELYNLTYGTDEYNAKAAELSGIEERIKATEQLASQYEGLASAYQEWQMAESSGSQRDMYESMIEGLQNIDDEISRGWYDDATIEFLELLSGKDLSTAGIEEQKKAYKELGKTIEHTSYSVRDFFTVDDDGNSTNTGVYNFLDAVGQLEEEAFGGKDVVQRDKKGNVIGFDFQVVGGDEVIAEALGISEELVQIMVRAADDAGFVVSMDGTYQQLDILKEKAQEAANELKNTFKLTDYEFNLDTTKATGKGSLAEQYEKASNIWEQFKKNKNKDGTVNMSVKGAEEAYTLVSTLQSMIDKLGEPVYMELDATQVEKDIQTPLSKLQEYETLAQSEHQLQLKGTDTSEIDKAQKEIIDYFENLDEKTKIKLGIEGLSREEIEAKVEKGEIEIPATVDIQMDMSDDIKDMKLLMMNELGLISDEEVRLKVGYEIDDSFVDTLDDEEKDVVINFISKNEEWFNKLSEEEKQVTVEIIAKNKDWYNKLDDDEKEIVVELVSRGVDIETLTNDETKNIIVDFATKNDDLFDKLDDKETKIFVKYIEENKDAWEKLDDDEKEIFVELIASGVDIKTLTDKEEKEVVIDFVTKNEDEFEKLEDEEKQVVVDIVTDDKALKALEEHGVEIEAFCNIFGVEKVDDLKERLKGLDDEQILVVTEVIGKIKVDQLKTAMDGLEDEDVKAIADAIGKGDVDALRTAVFNLEDKEIEALAKALGYNDVNELKGAMDNLTDKDVQAIAKTLGITDVDSLKAAIDRLSSKDVEAVANVDGTDDVNGLKGAIDNLKGKTVTVWADIKKKASSLWDKLTGGGGVDGTAHVDGTAFSNGTTGRAFKQGNWGTKDSGIALGGEEDPELLVRNGRWHLIGEKGAEFFGYKRGDIIFNASQTKEIFEKGKITHGNGRGKALVSGTAFKGGSTGTGGGLEPTVTSYTVGTKDKDTKNTKNTDKDFEETFDWIERAIKKVERAIDNLDQKANRTWKSWSSRNSNLTSEISKINEEIDLQNKAYNAYMAEANSVGLAKKWRNKVKNGTLDISTIKNEKLAEKIKSYQDYYDKATQCKDTVQDLIDKERELYKQKFDNVTDKYDARIGRIDNKKSSIEQDIDRANYKVNVKNLDGSNYKKLVTQEQNTITELQAKKKGQEAALKEAMKGKNGIKENSQDWLDMKAEIDATDLAIKESANKISQYYSDAFDRVGDKYDGILQGYEHTESMLNEYVSQAEAKGRIVSKEYYSALVNNEKNNIATLKKQQADMIKARDEAVASGAIKEGSLEWHNMCGEIDGVTQAIASGETELINYANAMRDIDWEVFDLIQERISNVNEEADFLIDLMSNDKLFDDNGKMTDEGMTTMALRGQKYNTHMYQADEYGAEIKSLDAQITDDPLNQDLINRRQELIELQRESILAAEDEKNSIKSLVEEGIELELSALQEKIDKKNEELESEKELYDYQKKVKEQTEEIADLEKQMTAYSGDDSEEAQAKLQELKVSLNDAKENLKETEWDKAISDQNVLMDNLYTEYEDILNTRLDNVDALIGQVIEAINLAAGAEGGIATAFGTTTQSIQTTLSEQASAVGTTLSTEMQNIWTAEGGTNAILSTYAQSVTGEGETTIRGVLSGIKTGIENLKTKTDEESKKQVEQPQTQPSSVKDPVEVKNNNADDKKPNKSTVDDKKTDKKSTKTQQTKKQTEKKIIKKGGKIKAAGAKIYDYKGDKSGERQLYRNDPIYKVIKMDGNWVQVRYHKLKSGITGWFKKGDVKAYKTGAKLINETMPAWTQEAGTEFIVRPSDGAILTPVAKNDSILNANASNNIWNMANSPAEFIKENLGLGISNIPNNSSVQNTITQNLDNVVFNFPNVHNYNEMLAQMQKDKSFERLITAMTIDRINGGSSLAKNKVIK